MNSQIEQITNNEFFEKQTVEKAIEIQEALNSPFISAIQFGIDLKLLNGWVKLLGENPKQVRGHKYSFVQFIWIKIVEQLRNCGMSLPVIKKLRHHLFQSIKIQGAFNKSQKAKNYIDDLHLPKGQKQKLLNLLEVDQSKNTTLTFNLIQLLIAEITIINSPLRIAVFVDGSVMIIKSGKEHIRTKEEEKKLETQTFIVVSISGIFQTFLNSELVGYVTSEVPLFSKVENKLYELKYFQNYDTIQIYFRNNKIKPFLISKKINYRWKVQNVINLGEIKQVEVHYMDEVEIIENLQKFNL